MSCIIVKNSDQLPEKPNIHFGDFTRLLNQLTGLIKTEEIIIEKLDNNYWKLKIKIGDINPKSTVFTDCFYIGSLETTTFNIEAKIYGENLPEPQICPLTIDFEVEKRNSLTRDTLREMNNIDNDIV